MVFEPWLSPLSTNSEWQKLLHVQPRSQGFLYLKELAKDYSNFPEERTTSIFHPPPLHFAEALCQARTVEKAEVFYFYLDTVVMLKLHFTCVRLRVWGPNSLQSNSRVWDFKDGEASPKHHRLLPLLSSPTFMEGVSFQEK